ncbi:MAG: hypothetical protein BSOLF_0802 [Candidatus Carbobacillus altaicus]|uniref:Uncharacterized protein n=1 Tax=Candidatus Carbonibacillus altaicus TaxID=2163959 RepID=A0A2R6XXB4_9BACL|nr:MAG: hypothetical protein BSOLF_0802 [Candidatus Carbobacillus altaicus]
MALIVETGGRKSPRSSPGRNAVFHAVAKRTLMAALGHPE